MPTVTAPATTPLPDAWVTIAATPTTAFGRRPRTCHCPTRRAVAHGVADGVTGGVAREHRPGYDADDPDQPTGDAAPAGDDTAADGGCASAGEGVPAERLRAAVGQIVSDRTSQCDGELSELVDTMRAIDRLAARAVELAGRVDGRKAATEEGMTVDTALRLHAGSAPVDVSMVLTAADVLKTMPATARLFTRGVLSWGHVRALVTRASRLSRQMRDSLDGHLHAHADRLATLDPERRGWAIEDALDDHQPPSRAAAKTERQHERQYLAAHPRLDGSGTVLVDLAPESFAATLERLNREADTPLVPACPGDTHPQGETPSRGRQLADALVRLITATPAGSGSGSGPVRFTVIVDTDRITDTAAAHIQTAARHRPPRLVRRALDRLACDAALDVVIRDGVDLIAAARYTPDVTAQTRRAVIARDQGCRFPGCTAPASWCDIHHVTERANGGDHTMGNLVLLCRRHHTTIHRHGWHQTLHPDGRYTITRHRRTWTTLPRRDQQLPPPTPHRHHTRPPDPPRTAPPDGPDPGRPRGPDIDGPEPFPPGLDVPPGTRRPSDDDLPF